MSITQQDVFSSLTVCTGFSNDEEMPDVSLQALHRTSIKVPQHTKQTFRLDQFGMHTPPSTETSQDIEYESMNNANPPKRFYRSFWRSAARRVLKLEYLNTLDHKNCGVGVKSIDQI